MRQYYVIIIFFFCVSFLFGQNVVRYEACSKADIKRIGDEWVTMEQVNYDGFSIPVFFNNKTHHFVLGETGEPVNLKYVETGTFSDGITKYRLYVNEDNPSAFVRFQMKKK